MIPHDKLGVSQQTKLIATADELAADLHARAYVQVVKCALCLLFVSFYSEKGDILMLISVAVHILTKDWLVTSKLTSEGTWLDQIKQIINRRS